MAPGLPAIPRGFRLPVRSARPVFGPNQKGAGYRWVLVCGSGGDGSADGPVMSVMIARDVLFRRNKQRGPAILGTYKKRASNLASYVCRL